jgi:hypothetical protein
MKNSFQEVRGVNQVSPHSLIVGRLDLDHVSLLPIIKMDEFEQVANIFEGSSFVATCRLIRDAA